MVSAHTELNRKSFMLHTMQGLTVELNPIHRTDVAVLMAWLRICLIKHTSRHFCRAVQLME